ncbi:MAG: dihydrolipoyllysine-residue succinyltransferase [Pelagibacterales bacterium MED-G40]|mgnify:FL=1|nr:MAG: dihydrolipoyllysine-residue succinyltransferase [Pelagibacterales bacterium MED-G40]|tara:strand:- start:20471 stop:21829 length:1359 start_codon:yes stop_codon:yes gene_type:complete
MSQKILVPTLGESVTEATVSKWLKNQGDQVTSDEPLVELETDKVNVEVPSPSDGTLQNITVKEGQTVNVGSVLGTIGSKIKSAEKEVKEEKKYTPPVKKQEKIEKATKPLNEKKQVISEPLTLEKEDVSYTEEQPLILEEQNIDQAEEPLILNSLPEKKKIKETKKVEKTFSPAARKLAAETNVNLDDIEGSGRNGIILKEDLLGLMGTQPEPTKRRLAYGPEERIKMTRLRLTIAKRLKDAQDSAAMLTTFNEVNMQEVIQMRNNYKDEFQKKYSTKLGFMSFFVKACVIGLKNYPVINAEIQGDETVYKNYYNISIAVGTDRGLVVPVLRNTDQMSFADIEKNISLLSQKARDGKINIDDLQGGTFTITNGGIYGSMLSTPILNPPQSAVLGMHNIIERPIVENGSVIIRPMMYLALSYDHRIIDGKEAVSFLKTIKESLEQPKRLFLNL